jgi:hypothetical protein
MTELCVPVRDGRKLDALTRKGIERNRPSAISAKFASLAAAGFLASSPVIQSETGESSVARSWPGYSGGTACTRSKATSATEVPASPVLVIYSNKVSYMMAHQECRLAARVLEEFGGETHPEFVSYMDRLAAITKGLSDEPTPAEAQSLAFELALARQNLLDGAQSAPVWLRLARLMDPSGQKSRRVPARFVRRHASRAEPPIVVDPAELRLDLAIRDLFERHADPSPTRS